MRLKLAQVLHREITCYVATAVQDERAAGKTWAEIGSAAEVSEASARACWSETKVAALLTARPAGTRASSNPSGSRVAERPLDWTFTRPAGQLQRAAARVLQRYLTALLESAPLSTEDVARQAGLPTDAITLSVGGELIASWPVTYMLTAILGGEPQILRWAWETASGERDPGGPQSAEEARSCLESIVRVLQVSAGKSGTKSTTASPLLNSASTAERGCGIPDWPCTERLAVALGAEPTIVRPFWDAWARAASSSPDPDSAT
ncbi:hypothetical protein [Streptomyces griseus]|uniref:hypothetical protein n=1 Tax=Streptomyces griseus TaxID=1911 RepID=UPI0033B90883